MQINLPIYRAKKINSNEYVEGYLEPSFDGELYECWAIRTSRKRNINFWGQDLHEVDPSTLSIHFPDMLDKNNKRIFASLSKDGKGGDNLYDKSEYGNYIMVFNSRGWVILDFIEGNRKFVTRDKTTLLRLEVTGIYEGDK